MSITHTPDAVGSVGKQYVVIDFLVRNTLSHLYFMQEVRYEWFATVINNNTFMVHIAKSRL